MSNLPLKHIVFVPAPSWGHLRPAVKTSLRLVEKFHELFISLFVYDPEVPKTTKYLSSQASSGSNRIRIMGSPFPEVTPPAPPVNPVEIIAYLEKSFKLWITQELQRTTMTHVEGHSVGNPICIIEDLFNGGISLSCKDVHQLPVMAWWTTTAASLIRQVRSNASVTTSYIDASQHGNEGNGDGGKVFRNIARQGDISSIKAGEMYLQEVSSRLICIPGIPPHHEWELATQYFPFMPAMVAHMIGRRENMIKQVDIIICCTTFEVEPISAVGLSNAFNKAITPIFIGPAVDAVISHKSDPNSLVTQFLERAYAEKGAHSVIYVAFGTAFFPLSSSMPHLMAVLDEIPKAGFRFIFALPPTRAKQLDESWIDAHVQAGNALFPEWTNQIELLAHPAVHYFLSHGGWSSSTEALMRGVPMILWPFVSDQPMNTMQIATMHNCGIELLQVRTGPAKYTAYQNGREIEIVGTDEAVREEMKQILELSKGPRGAHQRTNARLLGKIIVDSLAPGGSGDLALESLGKVLGAV